MIIKTIEITNIKGINSHIYNVNLIPNKPNVFVAPNGFGKTSFSIGFESLKRNKIKLDEQHHYNNDNTNLPCIKMTVEDTAGLKTLTADNTTNTISDEFDIFVINNQIKVKATKLTFGGQTIAKGSLEIFPTVLFSTIPDKVTLDYNYTKTKKDFGINGKILSNISTIFERYKAILHINNDINFKKFDQERVSKYIAKILDEINRVPGTSDSIKQWIQANKLTELKSIDEFNKLFDIIKSYCFNCIQSEVDIALAAIQLIIFYRNHPNVKKAIAYLEYQIDKTFYEKLITDFNTTRFRIKPKEDKKHGLIVEWPKADEISNGQRDILTFITLLMKAKKNFRKKNCILIIDEIFDYLDDANLISFQYFITDMIEELKEEGKKFFPILMTHLDPIFFKHFCFNKHKLKVAYLKEISFKSKIIYNLIKLRDDQSIKSNVDMYYFHYCPTNIDLTTEFKALNLPESIGKSEYFHQLVDNEMQKYLKGQPDYDPLAICFRVRNKIEEIIYNKIVNLTQKESFIKIHGTINKLEYCETIGIDVPETFYLLGIIYNSSLHIKNDIDINTPLAIKLENLTIKKLISTLFI